MQILKRKNKERQNFNLNIKYVENEEIVSYFKHFKKRLDERIGGDLSYITYWNTWIVYLRGEFVSEEDDKMYRMLGNYNKDEKIYKVIYKRVKQFNIYVPLTMFELEEHKVKFRYNQQKIKNKNNN